MSEFPALDGIRIGCVQYLNSRPLIHGLAGVELAHPRVLADQLCGGTLDAALVPVFELLRHPEKYRVVRGVAIASNGPVYSVYVAHKSPMDSLEAVVVDPASLTSVNLFRVLASGVLRRSIELVNSEPPSVSSGLHGRLLIGNQAMAYRLAHSADGTEFWDFGQVWKEWTGLPFVYAVWVIRRGVEREAEVADAFRKIAASGLQQRDLIAEQAREFGRDLAHRYLTEHIRFGLGGSETEGLQRFATELERLGLLPYGRAEIEFV